MTDLQGLLRSPKDDPYEKIDEYVLKISVQEYLYGSLVMYVVILALAV